MRKVLAGVAVLTCLVGLIIWLRPCIGSGSCLAVNKNSFGYQLAEKAHEISKLKIKYKSSYKPLAYPMGDVPITEGVCTDLVIRTYRKLRIDLQKEVHEDMKKHFNEYPQNWNLHKPDANIDHRRVGNLLFFFQRKGISLPITSNACDYKPGDIIIWDTSIGNRKLDHIGIVSNKRVAWCSQRFKVAHHAWGNPSEDDSLFLWKIKGHFRYTPTEPN